MPTFNVTLTDTEYKAMQWCSADPQEWFENFSHNRARIAIEEIVALNTKHCNDNSIAIAVGVDAQVQQAYDLGVVKTAAQRNEEAAAQLPS